MTRRTKAQWEALIEAHAQSGLTASSFCREHKINPKYFSLRRRQCADEKEQSSGRFIAVSVAEVSQGERIQLRDPSGALVELPGSISPQWLAQLLRSLRS